MSPYDDVSKEERRGNGVIYNPSRQVRPLGKLFDLNDHTVEPFVKGSLLDLALIRDEALKEKQNLRERGN